MNNKNILLMAISAIMVLFLLPGCQSVSVPDEVEITEIFLEYPDLDLTDYIGKYINFFGTIEFSYLTTCDDQIDDDLACQLYLLDSPHKINVVMGLNRDNITTSGNIIFSDGTTEEPDPWGQISALFTGQVRECDEQNACVIDIYQIDKFEE